MFQSAQQVVWGALSRLCGERSAGGVGSAQQVVWGALSKCGVTVLRSIASQWTSTSKHRLACDWNAERGSVGPGWLAAGVAARRCAALPATAVAGGGSGRRMRPVAGARQPRIR
eukprot:365756-Chlamydomonas_euryale.AAC.20